MKSLSEGKLRLISSFFIIVITILLGYFGSYFLFGAVLLISLQGMFELYRAYEINRSTFATISYIMAILSYGLMIFDPDDKYRILLLIGNVLIYTTIFVFKFPKYEFTKTAVAFIGVFYVAIMLSYIYKVRELNNGEFWIWLIFIASWGSDVFAYLCGRLFGKHKAVPKLSPNKTIEGCVGAILGAALLGFIYVLIFKNKLAGEINHFIYIPIVCGLGSIVAQIGDLTASAIKRQCGIKDYGKLIPGHGGIMDRFDSVIYVAPLCYFLLQIFYK